MDVVNSQPCTMAVHVILINLLLSLLLKLNVIYTIHHDPEFSLLPKLAIKF